VKYQAYIALPHKWHRTKSAVPERLGMTIKEKWLLTATADHIEWKRFISP
jgi:hypothetical protein